MKFYLLIRQLLKLLLPTIQNHSLNPKLPKFKQLSNLCHTQSFFIQASTTSNDDIQQLTSFKIIRKLIATFYGYFLVVLLMSLAGVCTFVAQPFVNSKIRSIIKQKGGNQFAGVVAQIIGFLIGFKLIVSILYVVSNFYFMILGVKMNMKVVLDVVKFVKMTPKTIACLEDDCQRLWNLPYSSINSAVKIFEFIILSSMLLSKLPTFHTPIAGSYWLFLVVSVFLAFYASKLNVKIMSSKQKRIDINKEHSQILLERKKQIKAINHLMFVDGVGLILPWVLNVLLMIFIYGFIEMEADQLYFVLIIFGLLRTSISGLGTNMSLFAQAWSSLNRISSLISLSNSPHSFVHESQMLFQNEPKLQLNHPKNQETKKQRNGSIKDIIKIGQKKVPFMSTIFVILTLFVFCSNFMYGFCAKSILQGNSVFTPFNMSTLIFELASHICLYSFACYSSTKISESVYEGFSGGEKKFQKTANNINRLSGDIRLLDRQLYLSSYGTVFNLAGIVSSFLYSTVVLNSIILITLLVSLFAIFTFAIMWLFSFFIKIRKECYRKEAVNKGLLLQSLQKGHSIQKTWKKIYTFKCFGYFVQVSFIALLYCSMVILSGITILAVMLSSVTVESSAILIMLISQLDSQYLILFIQATTLSISLTATKRCFSILQT